MHSLKNIISKRKYNMFFRNIYSEVNKESHKDTKKMISITKIKQIIVFIFAIAFFNMTSLADRIETENITYQKIVNVQSNLNLQTNGKIVMQDGSVIDTNTFLALDVIQYPVFIIPMNGFSEGWSDFELKASTNNFDEALEADTRNLVYFFESLGVPSGMSSVPVADMNAKLYFNNVNPAKNARIFVTYTNSMSLTEQLGLNGNYVNTVLLIPSKTTIARGINYWMYPSNDKLIWAYHRRTALTEEVNTLGRTIWHPIVPTEWRKNIITP